MRLHAVGLEPGPVAIALEDCVAWRRRADASDGVAAVGGLGGVDAVVNCAGVLQDAAGTFDRPMFWRMNHRGQRALREGPWKYLRVDGHDYLFDIERDARERANLAQRDPDRLARMRSAWEAWAAGMPAIPPDATVTLGYSTKNMPQR